jgi:Uma2 family endonuclease
MGKLPNPTEHRIVLEKITWQKFEQLLTEMGTERSTRFTYDRGRLELMTPLEVHDRCCKLIQSLILVLVDELNQSVKSEFTCLLKHPGLGQAVEPDAGYYFNRPPEVSTIEMLPDLIQETLIGKVAIDRLSIYANLRIPEIWQYAVEPGKEFFEGRLQVYHLENDRYTASQVSLALPFLPAARVMEFLQQSEALGLVQALQLLRAWTHDRILTSVSAK